MTELPDRPRLTLEERRVADALLAANVAARPGLTAAYEYADEYRGTVNEVVIRRYHAALLAHELPRILDALRPLGVLK